MEYIRNFFVNVYFSQGSFAVIMSLLSIVITLKIIFIPLSLSGNIFGYGVMLWLYSSFIPIALFGLYFIIKQLYIDYK